MIKNTISFSSGIERSILLKDQISLLNKLYTPKISFKSGLKDLTSV